MSLLGNLGKGSANRSKRPSTEGPSESLGAARLAIIFDTASASSAAASPQVEGQVPQQTSTAPSPRHAQAQQSAPAGLAPKAAAPLTSAPLSLPGRHRRQEEPAPAGPAQLEAPLVLAQASTVAGRHRRHGSRREDRAARQTSPSQSPRHADTPRSTPAESAPVVSTDVADPQASHAVHPRSRSLALVGALALL